MELSEAGELGLLRELERLGLASGQDAEGAILGGNRVATMDVLAEGVHFRLDWTSFGDLGYKAAAVNLSDLAAMGAEPQGLLVGLGAPREAEVAQVIELYEGLNEAGVTVVGETPRELRPGSSPSPRSGRASACRAGRAPCRATCSSVTGPLGGSAAGRYVLEHGLEDFDELVSAHRRPPVRLEKARRWAV